jgi:AraC-like DNA-binding protein
VTRKKMDKSPQKAPLHRSTAGLRDPLQRITLPRRPLSYWLRLAHVSRIGAHYAAHSGRMRVIDDFEIVFQFEGSSWIYAEGEGGSIDVNSGDVAFIPPGFVHTWASEPGAHIAVHFDFHARPQLEALKNIRALDRVVRRAPIEHVPRFALQMDGDDAEMILPLVTTLRAPALWREKLDPLVQLWLRRAHLTAPAQMLSAETISWAVRTIAADAAHAGMGAGKTDADPRILALLRELDASALARPSIDELAQRVHMGITAFRDAFHKATGRGPRQYIEERRVERASRALIETDRAVFEIAEAEGYDDPYHFSRIFRRVTGLSPRQYRKARREGN